MMIGSVPVPEPVPQPDTTTLATDVCSSTLRMNVTVWSNEAQCLTLSAKSSAKLLLTSGLEKGVGAG